MTTRYQVIRIKNETDGMGAFEAVVERTYSNRSTAQVLCDSLTRRFEHSDPGKYRFGILEVQGE